MFDSYEEIFSKRAGSYHKAMHDFPDARRQEFLLAAQHLRIEAGNIVCDIPAGGGYFKQFVDVEPVQFQFLETSKEFANQCPADSTCETKLCDFENLPLESQSVDRVLSLAALHHVQNRQAFFREARRIMKAHGILVIADVKVDSGPDKFLNTFVDQHNSMGHRGEFLCQSTYELLTDSGFVIDNIADERFTWAFSSETHMVEFSRNLFGLDQATDQEILKGIGSHLGYSSDGKQTEMNWELTFIRAHPAA